MNQIGLDFKAARARSDDTIARIESVSDAWVGLATEALRIFYRDHIATTTVEAARVQIASTLPVPDDLRWWGPATRRALRLKFIEPSGEFAPAASSNCAPKAKYRAGPQA